MANFVLDASVAVAWCFPDEATPASYRILDRLDREIAIVPSLWHLEMVNVLNMALRRKRINAPRYGEFLEVIGALPVVIDTETVLRALTDIRVLAYDHDLTAYDAAYLELAHRLGIPLASKDAELCRAARKLKVGLIEA